MAQRDREIVGLELGNGMRGRLAQLLQVRLEVAVLVEVAHEHGGDALVALRQSRERKLLQQVFLERRLRGRVLGEILALIVVAAARDAARRRVFAETGRLVVEVDGIVARFSGRGRLGRARGAVQRNRRGPIGFDVGALEQRVFREVALQLLVELDRRELQQPDRLLELRREREMLR